MAERLLKLDPKDITYLKKLEGLTEEQVKDFYLKNQAGSYFIKRSGLLYKMEKRFGVNGYSIITEVPDLKEYENIRQMMGIVENDTKPFVVMKTTIHINENDLKFIDFGTASISNTNISTKAYLLEMACTRSSNRAMRLSTNCGWTSDTELSYSEDIQNAVDNVQEEKAPKPKSQKKEKEEVVEEAPVVSSPEIIPVEEKVEISRTDMMKAIKSIQEDFGYTDLQLSKTIEKLFNKRMLASLTIEELKIIHDKMLSLKAA